jgi:hypothetical protein
VNSEKVRGILLEVGEMRRNGSREDRLHIVRYLRFQQELGNIPREVADLMIFHTASFDAEDFANLDPYILRFRAEEMDLAAQFGMANVERTELFEGYDKVPGMAAISAKYMARVRDLEVMHLQAWGESRMARMLTKDPEAFDDAGGTIYQIIHAEEPVAA